ncbi:MAG: sigma-54 dependent transcriptional regulator [Proteobacteria bacterium]|nr:sigma-54 dependent transcriptional regulator [Pseudomonadota bacterium]MBU1710523.1 sigma-54 dependent transcriptional regulator [Pseudomonadota bacterium]
MGKILIVEDSEDLCFTLENIVRKEGFSVFAGNSGTRALEILSNQIIDLVFLDIGLPDIDGITLISSIHEISPDTDIVMLTGMNDANSALQSLKAGAIDYMLKPFELIEFKHNLHRIMQGRKAIKLTNLECRESGIENILGVSKPIKKLKQEIKTAARVGAPVLISGETGTGKELVARAIHSLSGDRRGVFVKVDCGTLSANVIESELFGHEKGAFTDAGKDKRGLVETADGGTLFLDEIGNLPLALQPVLLRLIEESTFRRVGGVKDIHVAVRVIAATNINIEKEVKQGKFREDLFYRLNVIPVKLPPLRVRDKDILLLADYFIRKFAGEMKKKIKGMAPEAEKALLSQSWPGNVRELKNLIEREVIFCNKDWLILDHLIAKDDTYIDLDPEELLTLEQMERKYIMQVLAAASNNKTQAAKILNISRTTLRDKLK